MAFDSKSALSHAIRYLSDTAMQRNAGGWIPPKEEERQRKEQIRQELQQQREIHRQEKEKKREQEKSQKLLSKQFPTHYMPNVGRQVMQDGGTPKTISSIINRNEDIVPSTPDPTAEELAAARADTRAGRDIVAKRLNAIVPESQRVVGGKYRPGAPGGGRWSDLPLDVLNSPGRGFNVTDEELDKLWNNAVNESSQAAKSAVQQHNVKPVFRAKNWDFAMRLPLRDHLWYELSGEKMAENMPDLTPEEHLKAMDLVGATSARAEPDENLERSLAVLSQHLRNVPIDVDLTQPTTVRDALDRDHSTGSSALSGNKTGHFSDTLSLAGGIPTRFPISVNDVWVGDMFGISDKVMSSNQSLHEPMALYFNKIRDLYNERHGHEIPFKYQSWNFQAPAWVHLRNQPTGDAYHQVWGGIINKLKAAGVPGIVGDKITREAFMHPKFADALRQTTPEWRESPKATIEFGTKLTPIGQQAHDLYHAAVGAGDTKSQQEYLKTLITAMYHSARGEDHPWDMLKKAITGDVTKKSDITRIMNPTSDRPFDAGGTFEGAISPNIRIPLKNMDDDQVAMFNSIPGKHLKQASMAASQVHTVDENDPPKPGHVRGYSLFVPTQEELDHDDLTGFAKRLSEKGHDFSFVRYPNGYMFDAIPKYDDDGAHGIDAQTLHDAYWNSLGNRFGNTAKLMAHDFKSVYNPQEEYDTHYKNLKRRIESDYIKEAVASGFPQSVAREAIKKPELANNFKGPSRAAWDTYQQRLDYLSRAEKGFKDIARKINEGHQAFLESAGKRRKKLGYADGGSVDAQSVYEPHQRAEEQGYSIRGYHVTRGDRAQQISSANRFDPYQSQLAGEEATFFWDEPEAANKWVRASTGIESFDPERMSQRDIDKAERHASTIMPVRIHPGRHLAIDWQEATGRRDYDPSSMKQIITTARKMGFDTIRIKNMHEYKMGHEPHDQIAVLNPHVIRSEFAKFDPENKGRDDLGAARGGFINQDELHKAEQAGRGGDTMLAHINPQEAEMLKRAGGSGTINPRTGLPEFSGADPSGSSVTSSNYSGGSSASNYTGGSDLGGYSGSGNTTYGGGGDGGRDYSSNLSGGRDNGPGLGFGGAEVMSPMGLGIQGGVLMGGLPASGSPMSQQQMLQAMGIEGGIDKSGLPNALRPGADIGTAYAKSVTTPDINVPNAQDLYASSNLPLAVELEAQKERDRIAGQNLAFNVGPSGKLIDRPDMRTPEQIESTQRAAKWGSVIGEGISNLREALSGEPQIDVPNAGDLYGATNAPLAVNQQPSGMFGQPEYGTTRFVERPTQSVPQSKAPDLEDIMGTRPQGEYLFSGMDLAQRAVPNTYAVDPQSVIQQVRTEWPRMTKAMNDQDIQNAILGGLPADMSYQNGIFRGNINNPELQATLQKGGVSMQTFKPVTETAATTNWGDPQAGAYRQMSQTDISPQTFGTMYPVSTVEQMPTQQDVNAATVEPRIGITGMADAKMMPTPQSNQTIRENFNQAFAEARALGKETFSWTNPKTGETGLYTTQLGRKEGGRVPSFDNPEDWKAITKIADVRKVNKTKQLKLQKPRQAAIVERAIMLSSRKS